MEHFWYARFEINNFLIVIMSEMKIIAARSCPTESGSCLISVSIYQQNHFIKLNADFSIDFNGYTYDIPQVRIK